LWGCGGGDCEPGRQTSCACPGGEQSGVQTCSDDGAWSDCDCSGAGGTGGTTSTTSSSSTTSSTTGSGGTGGTGGGSGGCAAPNELCGSDCVDTETDEDHCGECDNACPAAATCTNGECDCPGDQIPCGTECIDGQSDDENCGGCGHDCLTGSCTNGLCPITELAADLNEPYSLALDATYVYWFDHAVPTEKIWRAPLGGGTPQELADAGLNPRELLLQGTDLYWSCYGVEGNNDGEIRKLDLTSATFPATPVVLNSAVEPGGIWGIGLGGGFLYFANQPGLSVKRLDASTPGAAQPVATNEWNPWDVAADASHAYWTGYTGGEIRRKPHTTGAAQTIASGQPSPVGLALSSTHVYWASETANEIRRTPLAGGTIETIATGQSTPTMLATDSTHVYWTNYGNGTVAKAPLEGGPVTVLATGQANPYGIAVDATHAYWTTIANKTPNGTVARTPK
jgi:hypothetical protein